MLQWMGGSRRKVATSRKSTQKRQKQYFEQRKRQRQIAGLENYADGIITYGQQVQHHEKPRSLDILSLLNLATVTEECNYGCTNARENLDINDSPMNYVSMCPPTSLINKVTPGLSVDLKEAKTALSDYQMETESPDKVFSGVPDNLPSSCNYSSNENGDKLDHWKTATEHQLSVLDLLGDDGPNSNSEESPVRETHVAFSVEGLGKVGMETPVHSPQQSGRILFNGCSMPPKAVRRFHSSKDLEYVMDDMELELNAMVHDINMPLSGSSFTRPFNSKSIMDHSGNPKSTKFTVTGCIPLDAYGNQIENFLGEEYLYNNMGEKNEKTWNATSRFLDEDFVDERTYGLAGKNRSYQIDGVSDDFLRAKEHDTSDCAFEGSYLLNKSDADKAASSFNILGSPNLYFKQHPASGKEYEFMTSDGARYPSMDESWDFNSVTNQPAWSYFVTEDATDSMSLLSEESCSSSAVRGEKRNNSASNSIKLKQSMRRHNNKFGRSSENNCFVKNPYAEETQYGGLDEIHQGNNLKGSGKHTRVPNQFSSKPDHYSEELCTVHENLRPPRGGSFTKGHTLADKGLGFSSFGRISTEKEPTSFDCKFLREDLFGAFPIPILHPNAQSSHKRSKIDVPVKRAQSVSEEAVFHKPLSPEHSCDSPIFSNIVSRSRKPDVSPASDVEGKLPDSSDVADSQEGSEVPELSGRGSVSKVEDKSVFQQADCRKFLNEELKGGSIWNNDVSPENGKTMDAADSKDNCSGHKGSKDEIQELNSRPKTRGSPKHAEETSSAMKEIPGKLENSRNEKYQFDAHINLPSQSEGKEDCKPGKRNIGNKGRNSSADPTYQVLLESYVLQLLCVQKVLKEASEQDTSKKA